MPTYSYECTECGDRFDAVQSFTDDALTTCQKCSGRLRKLFNSVGIVFKGSGFYRTDSREAGKKSNGSTAAASTGDSTNGSGGSSGSSETKSGSGEKSGGTDAKSSSKTTATSTSS